MSDVIDHSGGCRHVISNEDKVVTRLFLCQHNDLLPLQWRHNGRDSISNDPPHDCLLNRLFRHRSKKTSKLRITGLCAWNSPGSGEFAAQMASCAEKVSILWRHHVISMFPPQVFGHGLSTNTQSSFNAILSNWPMSMYKIVLIIANQCQNVELWTTSRATGSVTWIA